jgi:microcystin-dependent protein
MSEPFIGEIKMFAGNFAPRGYAMCNGQLLAISQNTALFSILGTTYGGNGQTTFALPDLRGRVPMHEGQGPGLTNRDLGESAGAETQTLTVSELAPHNHPAVPNNRTANVQNPVDGVPSRAPDGSSFYRSSPDPAGGPMDAGFIGSTGGGQPHGNMQPYLGVNFIIALEGIFPSRN